MWSAIKSIFTTPDMVGKVVEGSMKGIDSVVFTKQEKTQAWFAYINATMPMNVSRRVIALTITGLFTFNLLLFVCVVMIAGFFQLERGIEVGRVLFDTLQQITWPTFMVVVSWYFWKGGLDKKEQTKQLANMELHDLLINKGEE